MTTFARIVLAALCLIVAVPIASGGVTEVISDHFTGATLDGAVWSAATAGGEAIAPTVDGDTNVQFGVDNDNPNSSHRSLIASKKDDFDLFGGEPIFVEADITSLDRGASPTMGSARIYLAVGQPLRHDGVMHRLFDSIEMQGAAVAISENALGALSLGVRVYKYNGLDIDNPKSGYAVNLGKGLYGLPTSVSWMLDGANDLQTITIAGTTFTDGTNTMSAGFGTLTPADFEILFASEPDPRGVYFASGLVAGNTDDVLGAEIDSINVTLIPEPSTLVLAIFALGLLMLRGPRRRVGQAPRA